MIVIYINGEGTAEKLSPQHVYQGSNQTGVTVFAPVPQTTALGIAFRLPDKTSTTYYPMTFIQSVEGLSQYEFTIPSSITQLAGHASIALRALFSDGQQTSQLIEFEIEPSVLPTLLEDIDQDAYDIIMQRLQEDRSDITTIQGQINGIEETADSAQKASAEAVETANNAESKIDGAIQEIAGYKTDVDTKIEELETQIAEGQGTIVEVDGKEQAKVTFDSDPQEQLDSLKSTDEEQQTQLDTLKSTDEEQQTQLDTLKSTDEEQQTQLDEKVNKSGDTMTGTLEIIRTEGNTYFTSTRSDTGNRLGFGIGSGGENRGIWDFKLNKWIYHIDSNGKVYVNGVEPFTVQSPTDTQKGYALYSIGRGSTSMPYYCIGKIRLGDTNIKLTMSGGIYETSGKCDIFMQGTNSNITRIIRYNYYGGLNDVYYIKNGDILELYTSMSAYAKLFIELEQTGGVITDLGGQTYSSLPSGATLIPVVQMWQFDPTKLNLTTANGWTKGDNKLKLSGNGVYLVSINYGIPTILVYDLHFGVTRFPYCVQNNDIIYCIRYSSTSGWSSNTSLTINTVAYKRIA